MVAYEIEKTEEKIILTPEDGAVYKNQTNGMKFRNSHSESRIDFKKRNSASQYKKFAIIHLDHISIPISESHSLNGIEFIFKTKKDATFTLSLQGTLPDFNSDITDFINPAYIDVMYDYFRQFINTILLDVYSNTELLDCIINGITPVDYLYIGNKKIHFLITELYHNKIIIECYDDEGTPVNLKNWIINEEDEILIDNEGHTLGISVEFYPVNTGESYEISNDPVNVKEIGVYKFKNNQIILLFQENTLRVEQNKQALIVTIAHTGLLAGQGKIRLVRCVWYNLKQIVLTENPGNDWTLNIPPVEGSIGEDVELNGEVIDPNGNSHDGRIRFYLID